MSDTTLEGTLDEARDPAARSARAIPMLVVVWAREADRLGEVLVPSATPHVFGRGGVDAAETEGRMLLARQRPGVDEPARVPEEPFLSRRQVLVTAAPEGVRVQNLGRRPLLVDGRQVATALALPGQTVEIAGLFLFLCVARPNVIAPLRYGRVAGEFGRADAFGLLGETPLAWELRDQLAFFGGRQGHVLLTGPSGSGKELAAQAIHAHSSRAGKRLVARNAATLPAGLIDAELFGNAANYPHSGLPERPGLLGEADGSTLFLDEIGELPHELQTHLLRVLDQGDYQRLGDAKRRTADLRLVAATNRSVKELKHDLAARLGLRLVLPGLNERREDVPLIARHLLRRMAASDALMGERFFDGWTGKWGEPRLTIDLVRALVGHRWNTHVRELETLLWTSIATSRGDRLERTERVSEEMGADQAPDAAPSDASSDAAHEATCTPQLVRAVLAKHRGVRENAWRELGLPSRHALHRLMKKYGIDA